MDLIAKRWLVRLAYAVFFLAITGLFTTVTVRFLVHRGNEVEVPALLGKTVAETEATLAKRDLRLDIQGSQYNDRYVEGTVAYQFIPAGELVRSGRSIGVYLSKGDREQPAPRVIGLRLDAAKTILQSSELSASMITSSCADEFPDGVVVAQDPRAGDATEKGQVALLRSNGPCQNRFVMPDLIGRNVSEVLRDFDRKAFVFRSFRYVEREDAEPRTVLETEPKPGTIIQPQDSIVFTLAKASQKATLPEEGNLVYVWVPVPPSLFRHPTKLWVNHGEEWGSYSIDFSSTHGENAKLILWLTPGSRVALTTDGHELWRKVY